MHRRYIFKMRLTTFSDYAFRVLIYLGSAPQGLATIADIAAAYGISENHLMKVVHRLARLGYLETVRGKGGGMRLARAPAEINVGEVLRATEDGFELVECMGEGESDCRIARACVLKGALEEATAAFLQALDRYTLADLLRPRVARVFFAATR
jgi:Rrf2 family transcriptional regulator, nitric oxide-sensitive transcriptional repressor